MTAVCPGRDAVPGGTRPAMTAAGGEPRDPAARLTRLFDPGAVEVVNPAGDAGVVVARGRIGGVPAVGFCTDATRSGGALGAAGCGRIVRAIDLAVRERCPVVGIWHSGGARLVDGVASMDGVGQVFAAMTRASGRVPQVSVVLGPAAGAAAYGPALTDVVVMAAAGRMFVTGPDVVRSVTGERIDMEGLGGPQAHGRNSGVVHAAATSEQEALARARRITALLGRQGRFDRAMVAEDDDYRSLLPASPRLAYDVRPLVRRVLDDPAGAGGAVGGGAAGAAAGGGFEEFQAGWARNVVIGLGRLGARTVGVVANNPLRKGGCLDSLAAEKAARFVRTCDSLGVPLVVIVDVPGYLPGVRQEWDGVIRRGAKLLHAFAESVVPRVTLITRKAYGGAYIAMNSRALGASAVLAWPEAEIAVMGAEAAVEILHRKDLAAAPDSERDAVRGRLREAHRRADGGLARATELGVVDAVIDPAQTRRRVAAALADAGGGRGRHGNIPL